MNRIKRNITQIYFEILKEPLNAGSKGKFLLDFFRWKLFHKYLGKKWIVRLENNFRSIVYPFPDHDAGEVNIWTRNVDFYEIRFVRSHLHPGDFVCDVGCNIGNRTLALADIAGGGMLFDAGKKAIERAQENFRLNNLGGKYIFHHKAVGAEPGKIYFTDLGGASTVNKIVTDGDQAASHVEVELTTVDLEISRANQHPVYLKIDTEGYDLEVLKGAVGLIKGGSLRLIQFERLPHLKVEPFLKFFEPLHWKAFALEKGHPTQSPQAIHRHQNLFAAPQEYFVRSIIPTEPALEA